MKKIIDTNSYFTKIYEYNNKKFVRHIKRKGTKHYPRTLNPRQINNLLKNTDINYPKLLRNRFKYYDEEYLEPTKDISSLSRLEIMEYVKKAICILYDIDINDKIRYVKWKNNQEFLTFQIDNFKKSLTKSKDKLNLFENSIKNINFIDSNNRKLTVLHSDIHQNNMIINNDKLYLIDWELCTIGDLAYELATHFILMDYTSKEKDEFINYISNRLKLNKDVLYSDINTYIEFELIRRKVLKGNTKNNYH